MNLTEAVNTVCLHLHRQQIVFTLYRAWEIVETHSFRVSVHQVQPENTYRTFDVVTTDVPDCWDVTEVSE